MAADFIPLRDSELVNWAKNISQKLAISYEQFGISESQSNQLSELNDAFQVAYKESNTPETRTSGKVANKNSTRDQFKSYVRILARIIQSNPNITNTDRLDLGLSVRGEKASAINKPEIAPDLQIISVTGKTVQVRLTEKGAFNRRKPDGVIGASLFAFIGREPSEKMSDWIFMTSTSRIVCDVTFGADVPAGSQVWIAAFWQNPRLQNSPMSSPKNTYIAGGLSKAA